VDTPPPKEPSRHKIPVDLGSDGALLLPRITMNELNHPYKTKDVQQMLMEYMRAHSSMFSSHYQKVTVNTYVPGYVTGKPNLVIPWGKITENPASWIKQECYPEGFQWKHPSKIKIQDVFHLLNHWRDRSEKGEEPLIWVTTSSLFHNIHRPSRQVQRNNRAPVQEESSDGERFILPRSSEMDEGEDSDGEEGGSHWSEASYASDEEWSGFQDMSDDDSCSVIISSQRDPYEQGDMSICEYKNASLYSTSIDTNSQYDSTDKHMRPSASPHSSKYDHLNGDIKPQNNHC